MILIGITGIMGSGKTTIANILKKYNIPVIDADEISKKVTKKNGPAYYEIIKNFGYDILTTDGEIDRKKLAKIVFDDGDKRKLLENIIHPLVQKERNKILEEIKQKNPDSIVALDIPLLYEAGLEKTVDYVICAYTDIKTAYDRVKKRDKISKEDFFKRLKNQIPIDEKAKKSDFVVDTRKNIEEIELELKNIIRKIVPNFTFNR